MPWPRPSIRIARLAKRTGERSRNHSKTVKLFEFEAKKIFRENGIPVADFLVVDRPGPGEDFASGHLPVVIKAQVLTGGRGKAGGVKIARDLGEYRRLAPEILGRKIKGLEVKKLLLEKKLEISREIYAGYTIDRSSGRIALMFSASGGVEIEELAVSDPEAIVTRRIDILEGLSPAAAAEAVAEAGFAGETLKTLAGIVLKLYRVFTEYECSVAEINPLVITAAGEIVAADARVAIYDEAAAKHPEYFKEEDTYTDLEKAARKLDLVYVQMDGQVGVIGNGAGLNMATLDILTYFDGTPANFLEVSGRTYGKAEEAIRLVLSNPNVKVVFGNFFGCISRCDVIAEGLARAIRNGAVTAPLVVAMRGTGAKEGIETLKRAGLEEIYEDDIEAGRRAVELLKGK